MKLTRESYFRLVVWLTFVVTSWFAIPGTFWPHAALDALGVAVPSELVWAGFAFQLAFLVSMFSLPVYVDCQRYRWNALMLGIFHIALAVYWFGIYPRQTGLTATTLGVCELVMGTALLGLLKSIWPLSASRPHARSRTRSNA